MHVVSALRRAPPGRSYFSRFSSFTSASGRVLVVARHEPETPKPQDPFSFYCNFRDPVDWPKVLKEKLGLRRLPKVLSVVDSLGDESDPGVATTFTVTFDATKVEACDAELDEHVRMSNAQLRDAKKAMEKDAKTYYADVKAYKTRIATLEKDLKDSRASCEALEHERKLDELGEFAVKYRKFIVGFEPTASPPSSGKKHVRQVQGQEPQVDEQG
ncbi:hypothetical protein SPRG_08481 [Saprolegnia parasitica CBS 223.65]|uniref:DUF4200 domain-containing protein n=1 Tax=Saprolegnia parasitica (strain CBS 223.65) TaxID=695850 RepID=A0A067CAB4_SAPPC|nr:hypothetical protein SPRG_08481 [Saprolegnia parasitica CBS 223.65]KDO26120.1 hypothetical protein SPRG_08481 [Saprolegnia parasitica CBS 223.65]|eukprot:XP_012203115.1 hypothetical protein SPRG_08481 [Saprolegnia parasitica CBS 223.65]